MSQNYAHYNLHVAVITAIVFAVALSFATCMKEAEAESDDNATDGITLLFIICYAY